jgi:hypothetical protein
MMLGTYQSLLLDLLHRYADHYGNGNGVRLSKKLNLGSILKTYNLTGSREL